VAAESTSFAVEQSINKGRGPLVSVVVPCYKFGHLLPECVSSILAQTYQNFEVLIMDNCSPDNTPEVAQSFGDPRLRYIRNESNIGHLRNFNKGITMSRGKYVLLVHADDFLVNSRLLERFVGVMERNPQVGYVFSRAVELNGTELAFTDCGPEDQIFDRSSFLQRLVWSNCIVMSSVMVRKDCYDRNGLFPLDLPYACDWYVWCSLAIRHPVAYISDAMACWRIHEESLSTSFLREDAPVRIVDELTVLSRVAHEAELAGLSSLRPHCNASIANRAVRELRSCAARGSKSSLSMAEFEAIFRRIAKDPQDEADIRARVHIALGDEQYWCGEHIEATKSYLLGLKLRPWSLKSWVKYLLLRMGSGGDGLRRLSSSIRDRLGERRVVGGAQAAN
jgi:glycosyltransferase involved in cell wall biosynthesis